ncbi:MAG: AAA family ATPase [Candidatus Omnitrophica bacterium]|nr:AAA family ATPase [Candidatus Omnitrophota bacterium]
MNSTRSKKQEEKYSKRSSLFFVKDDGWYFNLLENLHAGKFDICQNSLYHPSMIQRYLTAQVKKDLAKKMVFLGGPRQVGKTTLALDILKDDKGYLNWDVDAHREKILKRELPPAEMLVFDEIHKYRAWRNYLKGIFDLYRKNKKILVTGSARLDLYRFGGDSLQGRYHFLRLHPLSAAELKMTHMNSLMDLLELGGFPEPFLEHSQVEAKRWSREYRTRLLREDVASLEKASDLGRMELLMLRLPDLVGSPLSMNALREDLEVSFKTVARWMDILERMYAVFRLCPFGSPKIRAVKKERKHYHFDWSLVPDRTKRFENMIASHLLKWVHFEQDTRGRDLDLSYFRDIDGREVDFLVAENRQPVMLVECKWADDDVSKSLKYLKAKYPNSQAWQIHAAGKKDYETPEGIRVASAITLLKDLV